MVAPIARRLGLLPSLKGGADLANTKQRAHDEPGVELTSISDEKPLPCPPPHPSPSPPRTNTYTARPNCVVRTLPHHPLSARKPVTPATPFLFTGSEREVALETTVCELSARLATLEHALLRRHIPPSS